jgi:hypothetical protein
MVFIANSCLGGLFIITPTYVQMVFGQSIGCDLYGFFWCSFAFSNFLQYFLVNNLKDYIGGFDNILIICLGLSMIIIPTVYFFPIEKSWPTKEDVFESKKLKLIKK